MNPLSVEKVRGIELLGKRTEEGLIPKISGKFVLAHHNVLIFLSVLLRNKVGRTQSGEAKAVHFVRIK